MSLPWFPFHIDKYLGDTMTLDTEGHGAYLLLMLHYYRTGEPPRDNDRTLAAIARLPMNRWLDRRPDIEAFFTPKDGLWRHERIEKELLEAGSKLASSRARAKVASAASHAKQGHKPAPSQPGASPEPKTSLGPAPKQPQASSKPASSQPQANTLTLTLKKESLSTDRDAISGEGQEPDVPDCSHKIPEDIGTSVPVDFWPEPNRIAACKFDGATDEVIRQEVEAFIDDKRAKGHISNDWDATWGGWWKRWREHRDKLAAQAERAAKPKAPPRVEVNSIPDWDQACVSWVKLQRWPSKGMGGEPGTVACRCPPEILTKHGIDPVTGFKLKVQA